MCKAEQLFCKCDEDFVSANLGIQQMIQDGNAEQLVHMRGDGWRNFATKQKIRTMAHLLRRREGLFVVTLFYSGQSVAVDCKKRKIYSWEWTSVSLDAFHLHRLDYGHASSRFKAVYKL